MEGNGRIHLSFVANRCLGNEEYQDIIKKKSSNHYRYSEVWVTSSFNNIRVPTITALGNFDGIHLGHRQVIQPVLPLDLHSDQQWGDEKNSVPESIGEPPYSTVLTFSPHPQEFFSGKPRLLLSPLTEKIRQLAFLGVEQLVLLPFNQELSNLSPQAFVETILLDLLKCQKISIGEDFRFGYQRTGTAADLRAIAERFGIPVTLVPLHTHNHERISSSEIRAALESGQLERVNSLLGRSYTIQGQVIPGKQIGRTLGFPTANLKIPSEKFLPCSGVYCVWVWELMNPTTAWHQGDSFSIPYHTMASDEWERRPGVMNIGYRPTLGGTQQSIEVHLLDWTGDLYGKTLVLSLEKFLRPEQTLSSLPALQDQIAADCQIARHFFSLSSR